MVKVEWRGVLIQKGRISGELRALRSKGEMSSCSRTSTPFLPSAKWPAIITSTGVSIGLLFYGCLQKRARGRQCQHSDIIIVKISHAPVGASLKATMLIGRLHSRSM